MANGKRGRPTKAETMRRKIAEQMVAQEEADRNVFHCCCCGKKYLIQKGNFPFSNSPQFSGNNSYLPICSNCFKGQYNSYVDLLKGNEELALRRMCMKWDIYFSDSILKATENTSSEQSRIMILVRIANMSQYKGKTYDDTVADEVAGLITSAEAAQAASVIEDEYSDADDAPAKVTREQAQKDIRRWGLGLSQNEYNWLNGKYEEMCSANDVATQTADELVRDYCMQKLQQNKALSNGNIDMYNKLSATSQKTLDNAKLTPKAQNEAALMGDLPFGVQIKKFEDNDPIPETRPEWRDVDKIIHTVTVYFLGHLMKMLGLHNRYAELYEEEMAKYRVALPELADADDEEIFEHILNNGAALPSSEDQTEEVNEDGQKT